MTPSDVIMLRFELTGHPVSVNHIYKRVGKRTFKSSEALAWEALVAQRIAQSLGEFKISSLKSRYGHPIRLEVDLVRESWHGKSKATRGRYVRPDVDNFMKGCLDAVFRALELDDSAVVELIARKIEEPGLNRTRVRLEFL